MVLWRFCIEGGAYTAAEAFSGNGSSRQAKRWNHAGRRVAYCATAQSLALLEVLVDLPSPPPGLRLFRADVPEGLAPETVALADLPPDWRETPGPRALRDLGDRWLARARSALLVVPSSIVPAEPNVLLSPEHVDFARIVLSGPHPFNLDPRLVRR